jgi:hypothetical protein
MKTGNGRVRRFASLPVVCLLILGARTVAGAPAPVITAVRPSPLVAMSKNTVFGMTIYGQHFWPSGPNDPSRRVLSVRRQYLPFQTIQITSMNDTELNVEFGTTPLLSGAGQLEFMVKIDGMASNVFGVKIVADPPGLAWVMPDTIALAGAGEDRWKVWLAGSNWIDATTIFINGAKIRDCFQNLNSGKEQLVWPDAYRKPGVYNVQVRTEHGGSEVRTVKVTEPIRAYAAGTTAKNAAMRALMTPTPTPAIAVRKNPAIGAALFKPTPTPVTLTNPQRINPQ